MATGIVNLVDFDNNPIYPLQQGDAIPVYSANELWRDDRTFTRPSDTTQYAAGDVIGPIAGGSLIVFTGVPYSGYIVGATLIDSVNAATTLQSELWIWDLSPGPMQADNAAFVPEDLAQRRWVTTIPFSGYSVGGATDGSASSTCYAVDNWNAGYVATMGTLHCLLVARNAYTPAALETFTIRLRIQRP